MNPGLEELIKRNMSHGRLSFTTDMEQAVKNGDIIFIAVGTPPGEDGSADLKYVIDAARQIGTHMNGYKVIINKSTVPVGTGDKVQGGGGEQDQAQIRCGLQSGVPERRRRDRGLHETRPRRDRRGKPKGDRADAGTVRVLSSGRANRS